MAVFYIGTYDIVDPNEFQKYPPIVMGLLPKYGGEVLASDTAGTLVEGTARTMNAIIRFPSKEAALGLYNDAAYQEAKRIRQGRRETPVWFWSRNSIRSRRSRRASTSIPCGQGAACRRSAASRFPRRCRC